MGTSPHRASLWNRVVEALTTDAFRSIASIYDRRPLIQIANSLGGPRMRLLHWRKLDELGRVPHSDEGHAVDALAGIDAFGAPEVEVFMVSHRWLRASLDKAQAHPDSAGNDKARALAEFTQWRRQWVLHRHHFLPEIYYWIDYCCIDQNNTAEAVAMLPLWVACCERFVRIETADYDERTWCRVEPLLSYVFSFADHHTAIGLNFRCKWPDFGTETQAPVLDPRAGKLTDPADMKLIEPLVELATRTKPANASRGEVRLGETGVKCYRLK
jgi:hypothetical protein